MTADWRRHLLTLPGIGFALLPKLACPMCWPVYASVLTSIGLGFLISTKYLFPLTLGFLLIAVFMLAFWAKQRRGYGPLLLAVAASTAVLTGKFSLDSDPMMYGGIALLICASVWNAWPRKRSLVRCQQCPTAEVAE